MIRGYVVAAAALALAVSLSAWMSPPGSGSTDTLSPAAPDITGPALVAPPVASAVVPGLAVPAPPGVSGMAPLDATPDHLADPGAVAEVAALATQREPDGPAPSAADEGGDAVGELVADFLARINAMRARAGVDPLHHDAELSSMARGWAEVIVAEGDLRHSALIYEVVAGDWFAAGENLAHGPDVDSIVAGLAASPSHRANMVHAEYSHLGVGIVQRDSAIWTVHLFAG